MVEPGAPGQRPPDQGIPLKEAVLPGSPGQIMPGAQGQILPGSPGQMDPLAENPWAPHAETVMGDPSDNAKPASGTPAGADDGPSSQG